MVRPVLSWLDKGPLGVELAGVSSEGQLYVSDIRFEDGKLAEAKTTTLCGELPYLAAGLIRPGLVVAVTQNAVCWLRPGMGGIRQVGSDAESLPSAIACFRHHRGKEVIVVCGDGTLVRVPALLNAASARG
jgi:hypothetical protein